MGDFNSTSIDLIGVCVDLDDCHDGEHHDDEDDCDDDIDDNEDLCSWQEFYAVLPNINNNNKPLVHAKSLQSLPKVT